VSVIVPAYRQAALIGGCLDSIAAQGYRGRVEVIVVDDGCPEGSGDVAARHGLGATVIRQANAGVAAARNRGIAEASGRVLAFVDADDRWHKEKLERQMAALEARPGPALSFTRYRRVDPEGKALEGFAHPEAELRPSSKRLARQNFIGCSTVAVHRACIDAVGGFPDSEELRRGGQDYALWLRLASRFPLVYVPAILTDYTVHPGNRVGADLIKNYEAAFFALHDFHRWDPAGFRGACGGSYRAVVARCGADLLRVLPRAPGVSGAMLLRALSVIGTAMRR
jgi:glycosyltransferase involved in cell wall biosynthesis